PSCGSARAAGSNYADGEPPTAGRRPSPPGNAIHLLTRTADLLDAPGSQSHRSGMVSAHTRAELSALRGTVPSLPRGVASRARTVALGALWGRASPGRCHSVSRISLVAYLRKPGAGRMSDARRPSRPSSTDARPARGPRYETLVSSSRSLLM